MYREDEVILFMLGAFILLVIAFLIRQVPLKGRLSAFFALTTGNELTDFENNNLEWVHGLFALTTSILGGILYYRYAQEHWNLQLISLQTWQLMAIYSGIIFIILILKQRAIAIINSIFFDDEQRVPWRRDYALIFSLESILLFLLILLVIFFNLTFEKIINGLILLLLFVKILVLTKDFTYFFRKIYGVLHLFMYFCALEAAPLLVLWAMLDRLTNYMITNI